ncbi:MAG: sensor histidine kinase [Caulobacteraceae bacterium]|nr:sensor histidine kinase [Caulobacteraceae bacterium]
MPTGTPLHPSADDGLAMAVILSSTAPLVLLDADLTLLAASASFRIAFDLKGEDLIGKPLGSIGQGEWGRPQVRVMLGATADGTTPIDAYEMDLERPGRPSRRLVLNAQKLDYGDGSQVRLLLSIADITDARLAEKLKDDLLREKSILLQELQHRFANSLQIIASVLLQSARKVNSEETRRHLNDAHSRVMSVAAVQQQLAQTSLQDVELRAYFKQLCASIGASMIRDHNQIRIEVAADDSFTSAEVSVSLGLIVTELVINALKHAFPEHRNGLISVSYESHGPDWVLSVSDDGPRTAATTPTTGPGLSISSASTESRSSSSIAWRTCNWPSAATASPWWRRSSTRIRERLSRLRMPSWSRLICSRTSRPCRACRRPLRWRLILRPSAPIPPFSPRPPSLAVEQISLWRKTRS